MSTWTSIELHANVTPRKVRPETLGKSQKASPYQSMLDHGT